MISQGKWKDQQGQREKEKARYHVSADIITRFTRPRARTHACMAGHETIARLDYPPTSDIYIYMHIYIYVYCDCYGCFAPPGCARNRQHSHDCEAASFFRVGSAGLGLRASRSAICHRRWSIGNINNINNIDNHINCNDMNNSGSHRLLT